jgi:hypothetical protein
MKLRNRIAAAAFAIAFGSAASAQQAVTTSTEAISDVVVTGEEVPSAYGAPPAFSRARFSPTVTAYVLPPGTVLAATIYEGDALRHEKPDHHFTQEIEIGLPYRINLAMEAELQAFAGEMQATSVSLEARWALADWNKIPLNPTIFAESKFGVGDLLHDERVPEDNGDGEVSPDELQRKLMKLTSVTARHRPTLRGQDDQEQTDEFQRRRIPDAVEGRLLLAQDFGEKVEWALNGFVEQEVEGDRGREIGFAQSIMVPLIPNERLKAGVEMQFRSFTDKDTRNDPQNSFVVGPSLAWKPNRWSRLDIAPLFGVNDVSPHAQVFVVFSMLFGGPNGGEAEAPVSTRNR